MKQKRLSQRQGSFNCKNFIKELTSGHFIQRLNTSLSSQCSEKAIKKINPPIKLDFSKFRKEKPQSGITSMTARPQIHTGEPVFSLTYRNTPIGSQLRSNDSMLLLSSNRQFFEKTQPQTATQSKRSSVIKFSQTMNQSNQNQSTQKSHMIMKSARCLKKQIENLDIPKKFEKPKDLVNPVLKRKESSKYISFQQKKPQSARAESTPLTLPTTLTKQNSARIMRAKDVPQTKVLTTTQMYGNLFHMSEMEKDLNQKLYFKSEKLQKIVDNQIQNIKAQLDDLYAESQTAEKTIEEKEVIKFVLLENKIRTYRVQCKNKLSPCIVSIQSEGYSSLMVYCSLQDPTPGKDSFDFKFRNPKTFRVVAKTNSFFYQFFYLTFESSSEQKIQIKVQFKTKVENIKKEPIDINKLRLAKLQALKVQYQLEDPDAVLKKVQQIKAMRRNMAGKDFQAINQNREDVTVKRKTDEAWKKRKQQADMRKNVEIAYQTKKSIAFIQKWDIIRQKRSELNEEQQIILMRIAMANKWIHQLLSFKIIKKLDQQFKDTVQALKLKEIILKRLGFLKTMIKARIHARLGATQKIRLNQKIRQSISIMHIAQVRGCKSKVQNLFLSFMQKTALITDFKTKLERVFEKVNRLQKNMKSNIVSLQTRNKALSQIWKKQVEKMSSYFMSNTKKYQQPFMKEIGLKLPFINEQIKQRILQLYQKRQMIYYHIRFLQWLIFKNSKKETYSQEGIQQLKKLINLQLKQIYKIDQILFMDYEIPKFEVNMTKQKKSSTKVPTRKNSSNLNSSPDLKKIHNEEEEEWNSFERVSQLMVPRTALTNARQFKLNVPNTKFHYLITITNNQPQFCQMPSSIEIIQRLILRGAFAYGIHDFDLQKQSNQ